MIIDHRYEVLENIGSGAWSNVYKVCDKRTGKILALKLFQYLSSSDLYEKFSAEEMHHITKIEHPNLVKVTDFGHVGDHIYTVCEYYDGMPLRNFKYKKIQIEYLYDVVTQIIYALEALHTQDIIHKDLKPDNVLYKIVGNKIEAKVIDFGFTKVDPSKDQQHVAGSLPYIAPEVYLNQQTSSASDYYSLGVMLYKITTGSFPFSVDQINSLITGAQQYFIPKFPSELNSEVPKSLEKFILRLLEKDPNNRFQSGEEIISYINRIQNKQYPFSLEWSLVNKLKFNSYISRESYCHQVLDYLDSVEASNGKLVSIIGGDGLGKDSILSLFRYHLLNNKYYLFDYSCSRQDHEPFFALIKEFMQSMPQEELSKYYNLSNISEKFKKYLFESITEAKRVSQNQTELQSDFESVKSLLLNLSEQKPIIFIIRNAQHIHKYTVEFINYISPFIAKHRILIVIGFNEYNKINQIAHPVIIQISPLTIKETSRYVTKVLNQNVPDDYIKQIWSISAGNPHFIKEMLIDHVQKKIIVKENAFDFGCDLSDYTLPIRLMHSIYTRINHIKTQNYRYLQLLSIVEAPIDKELMIYLLKIGDKDLYDFINDAIYNEVLIRDRQYYLFNYIEAKKKLFSETDNDTRVDISRLVIDYFNEKPIYETEICIGVIKNAIIAHNIPAQRNFTYRLYKLYEETNNQDMAYKSITDVVRLDLLKETNIEPDILLSDLVLVQEKIEILGYSRLETNIKSQIEKLPPSFEKMHILATLNIVDGDYAAAKKCLDKTSKYIYTGNHQLLLWLKYSQVYTKIDLSKVPQYLELIEEAKKSLYFVVCYYDRLSDYLKQKGEILQTIKVLEDFLVELSPIQDSKISIVLGSLHNRLGLCYSSQKNIEEADDHFNIAYSIWKRFNIANLLCIVYNNMADLFLKQGFTKKGDEFAQKSYNLASEQDLKMSAARAMINMGEAQIKLGGFQNAEDLLNKALKLVERYQIDDYSETIRINLALAKSKIKSFSYYLDFVHPIYPKLLEGYITDINPLIKTYFYYLYELSHVKKLQKLLNKNTHINYHESHEDEFYFNVQSLIAILNHDYSQALDHLKSAKNYASEVKNQYAITVFHISEIECYIGMNEYTQAKELIGKALEIASVHDYNYWRTKLLYLSHAVDLRDGKVPLRKILRGLIDLNIACEECEYFLLRVKIFKEIIGILITVSAEKEAEEWFISYKKLLQVSTDNIGDDDKEVFLKNNYYYIESIKQYDVSNIASRFSNTKFHWSELQYSFLNINSSDRVKFFIEKGLTEIIAPWKYQLMIYSEKIRAYSVYLKSANTTGYLMTPEIYAIINEAFKDDSIKVEQFDSCNNMIIPLQIKNHKIGFLILSDRNELRFTKLEVSLLKAIKQHISVLIMRIQDYSEITLQINMMNRLMQITQSLLKVIDLKALEHDIVSSCIDFTDAKRGFLIKKDAGGNNIYQVALDQNKAPLVDISNVSKTVLSECQQTKSAIITYNALEDNRFKNSISVHDYKLHSIFCAPLIINDAIIGFVYLDNFNDNSKQMYLNSEVMTLLIEQICVAIKNAFQYEALIQKSIEMQSLDKIKDEFIAIVSHELNTPLTSLQGYVSRLKRNVFVDEEEKNELVNKVESQVRKLTMTVNDIITMNKYNLMTSINKATMNIEEVINIIKHEIEIVSRNRKMIIKLEIAKQLPKIDGNWEAIHMMIYNIVLNAIRFTRDFGTIVIGVRKSEFQQEKIEGKESIVIYIQDNGIGIPEYQIQYISRKFYELNEIYAHKSGNVEYKSSGLGLGLAISKRIAELHNGNIWIQSKENEGTVVFISIPISNDENKTI
jgi:signal transduction histidine kinase/serine/threonine protein kinase